MHWKNGGRALEKCSFIWRMIINLLFIPIYTWVWPEFSTTVWPWKCRLDGQVGLRLEIKVDLQRRNYHRMPAIVQKGIDGVALVYMTDQFDDAGFGGCFFWGGGGEFLPNPTADKAALCSEPIPKCGILIKKRSRKKLPAWKVQEEIGKNTYTIKAKWWSMPLEFSQIKSYKMDNPRSSKKWLTQSREFHLSWTGFLGGQTHFMIPKTRDGRVLFAVAMAGTTCSRDKTIHYARSRSLNLKLYRKKWFCAGNSLRLLDSKTNRGRC